ncbi:hypothetical protein [Micromonospora endolithica]|uniref:hypothetical protein n=1 Tax=Micromonospora endolithica TaxID=230091 RepID=UPI001EDFC0AF|nr:hypothetical protein [Micromonospora endolithica]
MEPVEAGDVVELRVHGVSGAGAEQVLDRPNVQQVAGDGSGGFYRVRRGYPERTGAGGVVLEAYRWNDLPSGTAVRTLSLVFLLPFMLCNVATWMRPVTRTYPRAVKGLSRVLALSLTMLYVLAAAGVALDLLAWKCLATPSCLTGRTWLSWLGGQPVGLRLAVLSLLPVAAVVMVWRLGARPGSSFAAFRGSTVTEGSHQLSAVGQWDGAPLVGRLRLIHVAAAFATLDLTLLTARLAGGGSVAAAALLVPTVAILVTCLVLVCLHSLIDSVGPHQRVDLLCRALLAGAGASTVLVVVLVAADPRPWADGGSLPGYSLTIATLFATQTVLLFALWGVVLRERLGQPDGGARRGYGTPVLTSAAAGLAVAFSAELVYRVADLLDRNAPTADRLATGPPLPYKWAIFGFFLAVVIALAANAFMVVQSRPTRRRAAADAVARDFPHAPPEAAPRLRQVVKIVARAAFTERLESLGVVFAWLAGLGMATSTLGLLRLTPGPVVEDVTGVPAGLVEFGIMLGSYVIAGSVLVLLVGGLFAYRTMEFRRYVGVLWDLGTFWPRVTHPFAPPCYAERAVPELSRRITWLVEQGHRVLLTGHSHGSVLLAATVLQLPPSVCGRVALLTYGSPLHRLYERFFPAYVGGDVLRDVGDRVGWRWLNLWRDTDPIGGWIFCPHRLGDPPTVAGPAGSVDRRLRDPWDVVPPPGDSVPPPVCGHWPGESDPRFAAAVRELADRLRRAG